MYSQISHNAIINHKLNSTYDLTDGSCNMTTTFSRNNNNSCLFEKANLKAVGFIMWSRGLAKAMNY